MPAAKKLQKKAARKARAWAASEKQQSAAPGAFRGKQTRTGNSLALRFDRALFKSNPEFLGDVEARVIGPGRMLVVAAKKTPKREDPVIASFLSFLAADMQKHPDRIQSLDSGLMDRIGKMVARMPMQSDESLGDEELL